jgi:16S rRNA (guanine527-N7)-methyltransferase
MRPDIEITLVESSRKKATFSRHIIRILGLTGINVLQMRAEDISEDSQNTFDVVVSRATFSITDFMKAACPYLRPDGILLISKGPNYLEELKGEISFEEMVKEVRKAELPYEGGSRNLIVMNCV